MADNKMRKTKPLIDSSLESFPDKEPNDFRFIRHDILNWDIGYPDTLEMPDGKLYTVYWTNRFKRYFVFGHLYERWF